MIILNNFELFQDDENNRYYKCLDGSCHWLTPKTEDELKKYWLFNKYLEKVMIVDMLNFNYGVDENDQCVIDMEVCHADIVEEFCNAVSSNDFEWLFVYRLFITHRESHNFPTL
jgi:hypothetical protein